MGLIVRLVALSCLACVAAHGHALPGSPADLFREAGGHARAADYPRAIALYRQLAAGGQESASLYWNWAQAAQARGAAGEALWALLRARELEPGDAALSREIERLRQGANLDPAEIAPEPLAALGRFNRRWRLDLAALGLVLASLICHAAARAMPRARWAVSASFATLGPGLLLAAVPMLGSLAGPTAVVVTRGATLLDAASPTASSLGALREGEVVLVLEAGGDYLRVSDSAGARGWAHVEDVRPLDRAPK